MLLSKRWRICGAAFLLLLLFGLSARGEDALTSALTRTSHPLHPALRWASEGTKRIETGVKDYTCLLIKRERVEGELSDYNYMFAKIRHRQEGVRRVPFSVYLKFYAPDTVKDREVLFVEGQNEGKIIAKNGGVRFAFITTTLDPDSALAMRDNRYPITEIGFLTLASRLMGVATEEIMRENTDVKYFKGAKVDNRECVAIEVRSKEELESSRFYLARVYIDAQLRIPIHYESYDWPEEEGGEPLLLEQYTYRNVQVNVGLTDKDFQRTNPKYGFR